MPEDDSGHGRVGFELPQAPFLELQYLWLQSPLPGPGHWAFHLLLTTPLIVPSSQSKTTCPSWGSAPGHFFCSNTYELGAALV